MKTSSIIFILLLSSGAALFGQQARFESEEIVFKPKLGVCTSIMNHEIVAAAGFDYIEEGVRRFLIPDKSEEEFHKNMEILKESKIPIRACNGFLPGSLKSTGPDIKHDEINPELFNFYCNSSSIIGSKPG